MQILKASATIGLFTLLSRIMGFVRDLLMAIVVGASMIADSYIVAFRFPNMFRALFAEGAMNSAFVPIFAKTLNKDKKQAIKFAKSIGTLLSFWIITFVIVMIFFMDSIMAIQASGFVLDSQKFNLTVNLASLMFPYLIFMVMNSLFASILNSFEKFALPAFVPIVLNVCLIVTLGLIYYGIIPLTGYELAFAVLISGLLQAGVLLIGCIKYGIIPFTKTIDITSDVKSFFKKVLPVVFGSSILQLNIFVGTILATTLASGSVSYLYYADRLVQLPLGVIGIAVGVALIPLLSKAIGKNDKQQAIKHQSEAIIFSMFLTLPSATALVVIAPEIISGLFMYGQFDLFDTYKTAYALQAFAIGLPAFVLIKVISPLFFARDNTTIPVRISIICVAINIVLSMILMQYYHHIGIAIATSISAWLNVFLLLIMIGVKKYPFVDKNTYTSLSKILLSSVLMGFVVHSLAQNFNDNLISTEINKLVYLFGIIFIGKAVYFIFTLITGVMTIKQIKKSLKK